MKLEEEAKKFMKARKITASKKLEEILENLKLINSLAEITFKKLKEYNNKNNSNS